MGISWSEDEGFLVAGELGYEAQKRNEEARYFKAALGIWHFTAEFEHLHRQDGQGNAIRQRNNLGVYALVDAQVTSEKEDPNQGLKTFLRLGTAEGSLNQFAYYVGSGVVYRGLLPSRAEDELGLAVAVALVGDDYKQLQRNDSAAVSGSEVAWELTYRWQLVPWFAVIPDLQWVMNPNADPTIDDAFITTTRFEMLF
jgi:porin